GGNFSPGDPPKVLFGARPAIAYALPDGATLDVIPPDAPDGSLVSVAVIGSDGQSCVRDDYFRYVPVPVVTDLVDGHQAPVRVLRASGGETVALRGTGLDEVRSVFVGTTPAASFALVSSSQIEIVTPAFSGASRIVVRDEFGRDALSGFEVACLRAPDV